MSAIITLPEKQRYGISKKERRVYLEYCTSNKCEIFVGLGTTVDSEHLHVEIKYIETATMMQERRRILDIGIFVNLRALNEI